MPLGFRGFGFSFRCFQGLGGGGSKQEVTGCGVYIFKTSSVLAARGRRWYVEASARDA